MVRSVPSASKNGGRVTRASDRRVTRGAQCRPDVGGVILGAAARGCGASEADLVATERRLGVRLPLEVRAFYAASDGCGTVEEFIYSLRPHGALTWARDDATLVVLAEEDIACEGADGERVLGSLVLTDDADAGYVVVDPRDGAVGHWHAWWAEPWAWHSSLVDLFAAGRGGPSSG